MFQTGKEINWAIGVETSQKTSQIWSIKQKQLPQTNIVHVILQPSQPTASFAGIMVETSPQCCRFIFTQWLLFFCAFFLPPERAGFLSAFRNWYLHKPKKTSDMNSLIVDIFGSFRGSMRMGCLFLFDWRFNWMGFNGPWPAPSLSTSFRQQHSC